MDKLSTYEHLGILVPGSVLLFGLTLLSEGIRSVIAPNGIELGGFGVFVIVAYACGHLLAAIGRLPERLVWSCLGGLPSEWVVRDEPKIVNEEQIIRIADQLRSRYSLQDIPPLRGMTPKAWAPLWALLYRDVLTAAPGRVPSFNASYGVTRGLTSAFLVLAATTALMSCDDWEIVVALFGAATLSTYRMYRFGVHFAAEAYTQFLLLPSSKGEGMKGDESRDF